jgi:hypothetical protein
MKQTAEEIERFKRLWESRNPEHETNLDTGEDMFWSTALMVCKEFAAQPQTQEVKSSAIGEEADIKHGIESLEYALAQVNGKRGEIAGLGGLAASIRLGLNVLRFVATHPTDKPIEKGGGDWIKAEDFLPGQTGRYDAMTNSGLEASVFYASTLGGGKIWLVPDGVSVTHWKSHTQQGGEK